MIRTAPTSLDLSSVLVRTSGFDFRTSDSNFELPSNFAFDLIFYTDSHQPEPLFPARAHERLQGLGLAASSRARIASRRASSIAVVAQQVADAQRRHAGLPRAEEVAGPAQREVALGDDEAVGRLGQRLEPLAAAAR